MTAPASPDDTARPSVAVVAVAHTESLLNQALSKVLAGIGCVFFGYLTILEAKSAQPSNVRLALGAVPTLFCLAMLCTDLFVGVVQRLMPFLPAKYRGGSS